MDASRLLAIYNLMERHGIKIWIDGGWCVDALVGKQTRDHADLDIAVRRRDNDRLHKLLEAEGYSEVTRRDSSDWMYVAGNRQGNQVDVHVFEYDKGGNNSYGVEYPFGSLTGTGRVNGQQVRCVDAKWMLRFKTAYPPKAKDRHDIALLEQLLEQD